MKFTVLQVATQCGVSKDGAYGLIVFLKEKGLAKQCGTLPKPPGEKGKGQNLYEMDQQVAVDTLGEMFKNVPSEWIPQ